jgi:hypothetical protein
MANKSTKRKTTEEFIEKAKSIHGNRYDYSLVEYKNNKTKVAIVCPIHGIFYQIAQSHIRGRGCFACNGNYKYSTDEFIMHAQRIHSNKYDYSLVNYTGYHEKISIICPIHGKFDTLAYMHLQGQGCFWCGRLKVTKSLDTFINQSRKVHGNKYNYDNVVYKNTYTKVEIICPKHGSFLQTPDSHYRHKHGCPLCSTSKGETKIINYLINKNIKFESQKIFKTNPSYSRLRFDFYLPDTEILIEFNGRQHYKSIDYFKHNRSFEYQVDIDNRKHDFANKYKKNLIVIPYWDYDNVETILDELLIPNAR